MAEGRRVTSGLDEWIALYKDLGFKLYMAKSMYLGQSVAEYQRSKGKVSNRSAKRYGKRIRPAFDGVADAVAACQACRNSILDICAEESLDWAAIVEADEELKEFEQENREYVDVTSDEELLEVVSRWRPEGWTD